MSDHHLNSTLVNIACTAHHGNQKSCIKGVFFVAFRFALLMHLTNVLFIYPIAEIPEEFLALKLNDTGSLISLRIKFTFRSCNQRELKLNLGGLAP